MQSLPISLGAATEAVAQHLSRLGDTLPGPLAPQTFVTRTRGEEPHLHRQCGRFWSTFAEALSTIFDGWSIGRLRSGAMRLQLAIQRHGLPVVRILWNIDTISTLKHDNSSLTVSQFLEQVNEIIPLEAEDWGLEDYAVEVGGFECLHFSELSQVLKEDDVVQIRALETSDLKSRKFSGRHQITSDGRHLIDGIAFGRPYLQKPHRPEVRIPPRKRRRIIYEDADETLNDDDVNDDSFALPVNVLRGDDDEVSNESQDDNYADPEVADNTSLEEELKGLQEDLHYDGLLIQNTEAGKGPHQRSTRGRTRSTGLGLSLPYYGPYYNPLLDEYFNDEPHKAPSPAATGKRRSERRNREKREAALPTDESQKFTNAAHAARRSSATSNKSVHFDDEEEEETTTPATVRIADESDDEDDGDYDPDEDHDSDKENTKPGKGLIEEADDLDTESSSSSSFAPSAHSQDESSPFGSSPSDSSTEQYSEKKETDPITPSNHNSDSLEVSTVQLQSDTPQTRGNRDEESRTRKSSPNSDRGLETKASIPMAPPGLGKLSTQKRNARRRAAKLKKKLENGRLLTHDAQTDRSEHSDVEKRPKPRMIAAELKGSQIEARVATFEARKQALLDSIMSEGPDVHKHANEDTKKATINRDAEECRDVEDRGSVRLEQADVETHPHQGTYSQARDTAIKSPRTSSLEVPDSCPDDTRVTPKEVEADPKAKSVSPKEVPSLGGTPTSSQPRRARLDLASSKRMLFGSLGLRTPKTKEDEIALREKLMKDARPTHISQGKAAESALESEIDTRNDGYNWIDKIDLRAVECCHEGIKLSTPPFPFVQRWDPQQQRTQKPSDSRNVKRSNKRKRDRSDFPEGGEETPALIKRIGQADIDSMFKDNQILDQSSYDKANGHSQDDFCPHQELKESHEVNEGTDRAQDPIQKNTEALDLSPLPDDLSVYPELQVGACESNAIIAFKRFLMSADTKWQPCISDYVTALVNNRESDGVLSVTLAKRDRVQHNARFDQQTGERLYDKFEMPGFEGDASAGDGILEIPFNELISPRLIKPSDTKISNDPDHAIDEPAPVKDSSELVTLGHGDHGSTTSLTSSIVKKDGNSHEMHGNILQLIKESGWRSSLGSELERNLQFSAEPRHRTKSKDSISQKSSANSPKETDSVLPEAYSDSFNVLENSEIQSSQPHTTAHPEEKSESPSLAHSRVEHPTLGLGSDDTEGLGEQRQHRSLSLDNDRPTLLQSSISPPSLRGPRRKESISYSPSEVEQDSYSPAPALLDGTVESDGEFPELFSQAFEARMSQDLPIKDESSQEQDIQHIPLDRSKARPKRKTSTVKSKFVNSKMLSSFIESQTDDNHDSSYQPLNSQFRQSSQVIDLTMSSDPAEPMETIQDENDTSSYHPDSSPGWVNKSKANRSIGLASKTASKKRKTRSR